MRSKQQILEDIKLFKVRIKNEPMVCENLFKLASTRLLAAKYGYYVREAMIKDNTYDIEEENWHIMGRALGHLMEEDTSPCVGWNENHPYAKAGIELYNRLNLLGGNNGRI
jgi:hypothetical protein